MKRIAIVSAVVAVVLVSGGPAVAAMKAGRAAQGNEAKTTKHHRTDVHLKGDGS